MHNPLFEALFEELSQYKLADLQKAAEELTHRYRDDQERSLLVKKSSSFMRTSLQRAAYAGFRMPSTYAVMKRVLEELKIRSHQETFETLLDLGAGPGTSLWAAQEVFPTLQKLTLLEKDPELIQLGKRLAKKSSLNASWQEEDLTLAHFQKHDLVILSYVLSELQSVENVIGKAWEATQKVLVIVEPGTRYGFANILLARDFLIKSQAHLVAPCPHQNSCPLALAGDWCHFSERVPRSRFHKMIKGGEKGYEDEKYSYLIASKMPAETYQGETYQARIVRHPQIHPGHINLTLCTAEGLLRKTFSKKEGEIYKQVRKKEWGDIL